MTRESAQSSPSITVVIPAWDRAEGLGEAILSARSQDEPAEILIVDNASVPPVPSLAGTRTLRLGRRTSIGGARNAGLADVRTPYVLFLDADDQLLPGALSHLLVTLQSRPDAVMAAGTVLEWSPVTGRRAAHGFPRSYAFWLARWPSLLALAEGLRHTVPVTGATLHRTDVARAAGPQPHTWGEDWAFAFSLLCRGPALLTSVPTKLHRVDPDQPSLVKRALADRSSVDDATAEVRRRMRQDREAPLAARLLAWPYWLAHRMVGRRVGRLGDRVTR